MKRRPAIHVAKTTTYTYCGVPYADGSRFVIKMCDYEDMVAGPRVCATCEKAILAQLVARDNAIDKAARL